VRVEVISRSLARLWKAGGYCADDEVLDTRPEPDITRDVDEALEAVFGNYASKSLKICSHPLAVRFVADVPAGHTKTVDVLNIQSAADFIYNFFRKLRKHDW
jgi:hypothetical protein